MRYAPIMADADVVFFRYRDDRGNDVITNDLAQVPVELRGKVELVTASDPSPAQQAQAKAAARVEAARAVFGAAPQFHGPSFALGAVLAFAAAYLAFGVRGARRALLRIVVIGVAMVALGGLYFGWVLRTAGLDRGTLASPAAALDEARRVRQQAEQRGDELRRAEDALAQER